MPDDSSRFRPSDKNPRREFLNFLKRFPPGRDHPIEAFFSARQHLQQAAAAPTIEDHAHHLQAGIECAQRWKAAFGDESARAVVETELISGEEGRPEGWEIIMITMAVTTQQYGELDGWLAVDWTGESEHPAYMLLVPLPDLQGLVRVNFGQELLHKSSDPEKSLSELVQVVINEQAKLDRR